MDTYERIEQLALLVMELNKRVDVLEARLSPQDGTPKPESPEGTPPPAAPVAPMSLAGLPLVPLASLPSPKPQPEALRAYQERCKARLVAKAQQDPDRLPYWHRHAVTCGWILPTEGIEAILDAASQVEDVKAQFAGFEAAVAKAKLAESNCPF